MSCGCKKKVQIAPAQQPAKIVLTENGDHKPPEPIQPPKQNATEIVKKLNEILSTE